MPKQLVDPQIQAKWFSRVREAHKVETTEDYVELIADLIHVNQEARLSDLAQRLGVTHATASKVLNRLKEEGYVSSQPYRSIFLTPTGVDLAEKCKTRHQIILNFLISLGVSREAAEYDAEGIEHHISEETLEKFKAFTADHKKPD
ncbi:manganese-binding transcriptional regulator MntR [Cellvibrio polysaccharolyticus]|uniref:Transcriptional regulator MntR n=1 Tax=Cellvibrio polysaccharolyticus TaxID=2082724 RepID=A0A928V6S0_9GAMM|nr:manganese-binding transcriptional regulator MntR [Cellvibrio polysaccharolyticus]MBE8717692.1 transcriptional regulator MntR [Cellvibrio polysaccharolyticus]